MVKRYKLADALLWNLKGIEIGRSAHNDFGLNALNVDYAPDAPNEDAPEHRAKVDIVAPGDKLPLADNSVDFVFNSHVLEHFYDPIAAINEWVRVVKPGGFVFMIIPDKRLTFDRDRPRTTIEELVERHKNPIENPDPLLHWSVWEPEDILKLCIYLGLKVVAIETPDTHVGNGMTVVVKKADNI